MKSFQANISWHVIIQQLFPLVLRYTYGHPHHSLLFSLTEYKVLVSQLADGDSLCKTYIN